MAKRPDSIETIDLTRAGARGGARLLRGERQRAVLDAAAAIAARGREPTARAVCTELGDAGGVDYRRNYGAIKALREGGRWPYGDGPPPPSRDPAEGPWPRESSVAEELDAMRVCGEALEGLSHGSRVRVWHWLADRFGGL